MRVANTAVCAGDERGYIMKRTETAGVTLRPIELRDTPLIVRWRNQEDVRKNLYIQTDLTEQMHEQWYHTRVATGQCAQFIIECETGPIGTVFLKNIDRDLLKAEFGIFLGSNESRGKGYGSAAAAKILEYGFSVLSLNRIYLTVFMSNPAAIRSYEKAGFRREGVLRQDFRNQDGFVDVCMMSILKGEWEAGR